MLVTMFLLLGFHIQTGRLHIIIGDQVIVVANHRVIRERIMEDIELVEIIQVLWRGADAHDNQLVDYPYNPRTFGHSNRDYLGALGRRDNAKVALMVRLIYLGGRLVRMEVWEQDRHQPERNT